MLSRLSFVLLILILGYSLFLGLFSLFQSTPSTEPPGLVRSDRPIKGALVRWQGTRLSTGTDEQGRFHLPSPPPNALSRLTAWKPGYFIGSTTADRLTIELHPLPTKDFTDYRWVDPAKGPEGEHHCANCHGELYAEWESSAHARSATGTHFRNLYTGMDVTGTKEAGWGLLKEHPLGAAVCASCHAPTVRPLDDALFDLRKAQGVDSKGVHCDFCHKIAGPEDDGELGLTHGRYGLKLLRPKKGQLFFGTLDDVDRGEDAFSPFYQQSRYCASCHEGIVFGTHVYSTFSEWQKSPAAAKGIQCQDCHMKSTGRTNIAPGRGGIERDPETLSNHRFWDGSQQEMLKRCLSLDVTLTRKKNLHVQVSISAKGVGHRVPSGFIDRHLILVVEAFAGEKELSMIRGAKLPAAVGQTLSGKAGHLFAKILRDSKGRFPVPFWRAGGTMTDTRLKPESTQHFEFAFPKQATQIRARLIYRRFWQEVIDAKGWKDQEILVKDWSRRLE